MEKTEEKIEQNVGIRQEDNSKDEALRQEEKVPKYRYRIDKLLSKKDIKYRGIFSYRTLKLLGFLLMIFSQVFIAYSFVNKIIALPETTLTFLNVLEIASVFALPMFLAANFCIIMSSKNKIKRYLIVYSITAILIYLTIVLIYYRYLYGAAYAITQDAETATNIANSISDKLFGGMVNYNVFIDLSLFSMFFFFLFYNPKKQLSKKGMTVFRWCSLIPVVFAVVAFVLYALNFMQYLELPMAVLALLPCRSLTVYIIMFVIALAIKWRKHTFYSWGGTKEEYANYLQTKRNSLEVSVMSSIIVFVLCILDLVLVLIVPHLFLFGFGTTWYMIAIVPFLFLLSYSRQPKYKSIDYALPALFIISCIIVYLEAVMYVIVSA